MQIFPDISPCRAPSISAISAATRQQTASGYAGGACFAPIATSSMRSSTTCSGRCWPVNAVTTRASAPRSEEHTSELQSRGQLVCRLLHEKKKLENQRLRPNEQKRRTRYNQSNEHDTLLL